VQPSNEPGVGVWERHCHQLLEMVDTGVAR
jgi:hypothetical protein